MFIRMLFVSTFPTEVVHHLASRVGRSISSAGSSWGEISSTYHLLLWELTDLEELFVALF